MKDSIAEEKQAKKKLEDLMHTEEDINKSRTELEVLNNKYVILLYGQSGSGKSTLANKFIRDTKEPSKINVVKSNAQKEIKNDAPRKEKQEFLIRELSGP